MAELDVLTEAETATTPSRAFKWSAQSYLRASAAGLFGDTRVELIEGEILELNAHSKPHIVGANKAFETLRFAFPRGYVLTNQSTLYADERSRPEPDIAVFRGEWNDLLAETPLVPVLICEASLETLSYDRGRKASLYASFGVLDYWILNLREGRLEVLRDPQPMTEQTSGFGYASTQFLSREQEVSPLELPQVSVSVADLLP